MDDWARHNQAQWEALAEARIAFTRPWPDLDAASACGTRFPRTLLSFNFACGFTHQVTEVRSEESEEERVGGGLGVAGLCGLGLRVCSWDGGILPPRMLQPARRRQHVHR